MTDKRNALDKYLDIPESNYTRPWARHEALMEHVGNALAAQDYAAAQVLERGLDGIASAVDRVGER